MSSSEAVRLVGNKIVLRDWHLVDLRHYAHWLEPGHRWKELDGPYYPLPDALKRAERIEEKRELLRTGDWPEPRRELVIAAAGSDEFLGRVVWNWYSEETLWLMVGIDLYDPSRWGDGRGFEALGLWVDYLFINLPGIVRVDLRTWSGNTGMIRLSHKLGFEEEARFRKARVVDGVYYDGLGFGVLREEWEATYPDGFAANLTLFYPEED